MTQSRQRKLNFDGQTTAYEHEGSGHPTVVLLSGLGEGLKTWDSIADRLAAQASMFRYDRSGYGGSSAVRHSREGRDGRFIASHLKTCLDAAEIPPPYLLVGHSMGGLYALDFAKMYQEVLSGLVLIDMRTPTFSTECAKHKGLSSEPPWYLKMLFPHHLKSEVHGARAAERQAATPEALEDIPVTVIIASRRDKGFSQKLFDIWQDTQKGFVGQVENGRLVVAQNSGHYVQHDEPELVLEEILRAHRLGS